MEVVYPGMPGAFAEEAAEAIVGANGRCSPVESVALAVAIAESGGHAVVPVESSLAGRVPGVARLLTQHAVRVLGDHTLRVRLSLVAVPGSSFAELRVIASHPVALAQCTRFFATHPTLSTVPCASTSQAVRQIVEKGDPSFFAIGSARAARLYGAAVLREGLEDPPGSFTRFVLLGPATRARGFMGGSDRRLARPTG